MRARFLLIHNPFAGRRGNRLTHAVIDELLSARAQITQVREQSVQSASEKVSQLLSLNQYDAIVVAGGDGTVRAFANQVIAHDIPMGLIPAGTGNVLALEIGSPKDPAEIAQLLMHAPVVKIDGAQINGHPFFLMAGVGFDGDAIAYLDINTKQSIGKPAYAWPVIRALCKGPPELLVTIDGKKFETSWLIATRSSHYAGNFFIDRAADIRSPGMIAVLFDAKSRAARLRELTALALGRLDHLQSVRRIACSHIQISSTQPVAAQADGDKMGTTPVTISTRHSSLKLIAPLKFANPITDGKP